METPITKNGDDVIVQEIIFIINNISIVLQYFIPGFWFLIIFKFFVSKKISNVMMTIMSCVISYIFISFISAINQVWLKQDIIQQPVVMSCIAITLSTFMSCTLSLIYTSDKFKNFMVKYFHRTPNEDIWLDVLDFKNGSNLKVFFKEKENYLIGQYKCYEEKGADSWFALTGYAWFSKSTGKILKPSYLEDNSVIITFKISDVEHLEIF